MEPEETSPYDAALLMFATDFEVVKRLVRAQGSSEFHPQALVELHRWFGTIIAGAENHLEEAADRGDTSGELRVLSKGLAEAQAWMSKLPV